MSAPSPPLARVVAQTRLELRLLARSGESLVVAFGVPLGILVFFSVVDVLPSEGRDTAFLLSGTLAIAVMSSGFVAQAIQTAFERKYGVLKRLGATPLSRTQYLAAKAVAVGVVVVVQAGVLVLVALGLGWEPPGPAAWPVLALALLLGTATFTALGLLLAGALRAELVLAGANALYLVLLLLSELAFALPDALDPLVLALPSGALGIVVRGVLGPAPSGSPTAAVLVLLAWGVGAAVVASATFRWEP